jgi:hypothetical protein
MMVTAPRIYLSINTAPEKNGGFFVGFLEYPGVVSPNFKYLLNIGSIYLKIILTFMKIYV